MSNHEKPQTASLCPIASHGDRCGICTGCRGRIRVDEYRTRLCISCTSWFCAACVPTFESVYDPYISDPPTDTSNTMTFCIYCVNPATTSEERTHFPVCAICRECFRNFATTLDLSNVSLTRALNSLIAEYFGAETLFVISKTEDVSAAVRSGIQAKDVVDGPGMSNTWDVYRFGLLWVDFIQPITNAHNHIFQSIQERIVDPAGDLILKAQVIEEYREKFRPVAVVQGTEAEAKRIVPWIAMIFWEEQFEERNQPNWLTTIRRTETHHMCVTTLAEHERSAKHKMIDKLASTLNSSGSERCRHALRALDHTDLQCVVDDALPVKWQSHG